MTFPKVIPTLEKLRNIAFIHISMEAEHHLVTEIFFGPFLTRQVTEPSVLSVLQNTDLGPAAVVVVVALSGHLDASCCSHLTIIGRAVCK